ncbi:hypothetical protein ACLB2K_055931 [Fragaria x ananassa]
MCKTNTTEKHGSSDSRKSFFEITYHLMEERWQQLRAVVNKNRMFSLPHFTPGYCHFLQQETNPQPAFAWLKCEDESVEDCESFLRGHKILTRGGSKFGVSPKYVRISMTGGLFFHPSKVPTIKVQLTIVRRFHPQLNGGGGGEFGEVVVVGGVVAGERVVRVGAGGGEGLGGSGLVGAPGWLNCLRALFGLAHGVVRGDGGGGDAVT